MDQQGQQGQPGPPGQPGQHRVLGLNGQTYQVQHRRSPSELTPLMMEQLALQQHIDHLQNIQNLQNLQHRQQMQQYVNMGYLPGQPQLAAFSPTGQGQAALSNLPPGTAFQFPQQQLGLAVNNPNQSSHRRNQSAMPNVMGPPPAPSSGSAYGDMSQQNQGNNRENGGHGHGRGRGAPAGAGHHRRHSLALPEARRAAEVAQQKRTTSGFQFPIPGAAGASTTNQESEESSTQPAAAQTAPQSSQNLAIPRANMRGAAHMRSQSMAAGNGRGSGQRGMGGFQFPQAGENAGEGSRRQGHGRSGSRNFDSNWRQPQDQQRNSTGSFQQQGGGNFQPGHRARNSVNQSIGSIGSFQYAQQPQMFQLPGQVVMPQFLNNQPLGALQLAQLQAMQQQNNQLNGQNIALQANQPIIPQLNTQQPQQQQQQQSQQQQSQQRKTLFTPYLSQNVLPELLRTGSLVKGTLRVNKKNRSDAYVTCKDLDTDIFICGSKDRNRALEGDEVAVELLDVDDVWSQKREKEEKKKRKDNTETRSTSSAGMDKGRSDSNANGDSQVAPDGSIRRRGSLRQRPPQKKNDDVEVEGQSLLLVEEDEISDDHKPLFAGHVVAVMERVTGQMFSGTLAVLRPSSIATKEKQMAKRPNHENKQDSKPKIVWFKPTDKRVPLIAIPTEQAPKDFVENPAAYNNSIFVAAIKRWPITSLHPFGTLIERLGPMGDYKVETDALLRDNNFTSEEFTETLLRNVGFENWTLEHESQASLAERRDFRDEKVFAMDPNDSNELDNAIHVKTLEDGKVEIGFHVSDVSHFVKPNSSVDREIKRRSTGIYLMTRFVYLLPPRLSNDLCSLLPDQDRLTLSVVFTVDPVNGVIDGEPWLGKGIVKSVGKIRYQDINAVLSGYEPKSLVASADDIQLLNDIACKFREARFGHRTQNVPPLRLFYQLDDENVPAMQNIFDSSSAHELMEELSHKTNSIVAMKLFAAFPDKALLRSQSPPKSGRFETFVDRMTRLGYEIDPESSGSLQNSLFKVQDVDLRKGMETLLLKAMRRAKYYIASTVEEEQELQHYALNLPLYTHFTNPSRRYADIAVHRQVKALLSNTDIQESLESLNSTVDICNNKKDSAQTAQEQSVHIESCRNIDKKRQENGGDLITEGIVVCVYESAFDVLIPEFGFEKRVHCDQLPLKKAEFRKDTRVLELYWEKGVPSSAYIPEDEKKEPALNSRAATAAAASRQAEEAKQRAKEIEEAQRKKTQTETISTDDVDALFDDDDDHDDDDDISDLVQATAGVSLNSPDRSTQSMPPSPTRNGNSQGPHRAQSDPKIALGATEAKLGEKEKYLKYFKLREEDGECIQDVTEMTRVPIILKTDLSKSPPCLTIRSVNPYAL